MRPTFLLFLGLLGGALSKQILYYSAISSISTRLSVWPYIEALADRGHNVTYLTVFPNPESNHPNITQYRPQKWADSFGDWEDQITFYDVRKNSNPVRLWLTFIDEGRMACEMLYGDPGFIEWVKENKNRFDLIVTECAYNECVYGLVHYFKTKLISYSTSQAYPYFVDGHGLPDESGSITDVSFSFPPGNLMSFSQRLLNGIYPVAYNLVKHFQLFPVLEHMTREGLGIDDLPSFAEIERNVSLMLVTSHYSMHDPRSYPPNVIPIGGVVVTKKMSPILKDMEDFIKKGKKGFIFVSFGTCTEFVNFDPDVQHEFIQALEAFPELRFIWKSSKPINATLSSNILVTKWAPQQTLLGHPEIKAFVTHNGMGSTTEGIHFGVPMVSLPVMHDQDFNADVVARRGAGIKLEIVGLKRAELIDAISEILNNDKYHKAMTELSQVFRDRQVPPLENAVWWTEFVMRYEDTNKYIRSPSVTQYWFQKRQLDVWLFVLVVVLSAVGISVGVIIWTVKKLISVMLTKTEKKELQNKTKKPKQK